MAKKKWDIGDICFGCRYNKGSKELPACMHPKGPHVSLDMCVRYSAKPKTKLELVMPDDAA